jgi:hypothetical protein
MDATKKVIVGYDLNEDFTQISCYSYKTNEPIPISQLEGESEFCPIPTVLCVKTDTRQWLFGDEAVKCAQNGAGIRVDHLLSKLINDEITELYQTKFTGVALLEKFLRKSLTLIKNYFPTEQIAKLVITIRDTEPVLVDKIYEACSLLGIDKDRVLVMSHASAYLYYALSQDRSLWMNDVGLFDFNEEGLRYYQIKMNRRTKPIIAGLGKIDFSQNLNLGILKNQNSNPAYIFENIVNEALHKQIVTTLYITGNGFDGEWAEPVIKGLCTGRRVFYGQNLFTKGACYAARELSGDQKLNDIILLNDDMITTTLEVRVYKDTKFTEIPLAEAGEIWYEAGKNLEVIPEGEAVLDIILKNIMTRDVVREKLVLNQFPERPDRMTRLEINFTCIDKNTGIIKVTDLGFGEYYPSAGAEMVFTIEI